VSDNRSTLSGPISIGSYSSIPSAPRVTVKRSGTRGSSGGPTRAFPLA
jgi:hypothetical protein